MKLESLVIANQLRRDEYVLSPCTHLKMRLAGIFTKELKSLPLRTRAESRLEQSFSAKKKVKGSIPNTSPYQFREKQKLIDL